MARTRKVGLSPEQRERIRHLLAQIPEDQVQRFRQRKLPDPSVIQTCGNGAADLLRIVMGKRRAPLAQVCPERKGDPRGVLLLNRWVPCKTCGQRRSPAT